MVLCKTSHSFGKYTCISFFFFFLLSGQCLFSFTAYVPSTPLLIRIRNIARLVVRDASGGDHSFTRDAVELYPDGAKETIQLRGHGELLRVSRRATLLRDSQVCPAPCACVAVCQSFLGVYLEYLLESVIPHPARTAVCYRPPRMSNLP